jgi:putative flippase GtrA
VKRVAGIAMMYTLFATLGATTNLGVQMLFIHAYPGPYGVELSIAAGTAAALPLRYLLEKRYVFSFKSRNMAHDGKLFVLYSFMGVFTTALFWSVEYGFHLLFDTAAARYAGGVIGLVLGFCAKYQLDKKYVFVAAAPRVTARTR